ncbi:MAG TPA: MFS transporter, partial [Gemmatimonadales bacterium]|nr:MFS transporter [Gemmatimonadales bacterium]
MTAPAPSPSALRSASGIVLTTVFIDLVGFGIVLPILPSYAARYDVSDAAIGALVGSFSLMQLLFAPAWGRLSDRIGRRPVLLVGLLGSAVSYLLFAYAGSFLLLLVSRLVAGAAGATVNVAQAYLADLTPAADRTRVMGRIGAAFGMGFILGPAIGGAASQLGDAGPGLVAAALCAANLGVAWFRLPESRPAGTGVARRVGHHPALRLQVLAPFAVMFLLTLPFTTIHATFPLYMERLLGYGRSETALVFVYLGLLTALVQGWLVGRLASRLGEVTLMRLGAAGMALGVAGLALAFGARHPVHRGLPLILGAITLLALGAGLAAPSVTSHVSRLTPPEDQGRALGDLQGVASLARIVGPPAAGVISEWGGAAWPFAVASGLALLAGLAALSTRPA